MLAAAMSVDGKDAMEPGFAAAEIDTSKPHPARMYNAYLGGNDNYPADRAAVRQILRDFPEVPAMALANRAFLGRAVRFLAAEAGIRQFIDIGTGIPSAGNVHEVAGRAAPDTRVVYVDNDPIVHVHANALLTGGGAAALACFYLVLCLIRPGEMGLGDAKLAATIGLALGWTSWQALIVGTFAGFALAAVYGGVLLAVHRATRTSQLPLGPFILLGALAAIAVLRLQAPDSDVPFQVTMSFVRPPREMKAGLLTPRLPLSLCVTATLDPAQRQGIDRGSLPWLDRSRQGRRSSTQPAARGG